MHGFLYEIHEIFDCLATRTWRGAYFSCDLHTLGLFFILGLFWQIHAGEYRYNPRSIEYNVPFKMEHPLPIFLNEWRLSRTGTAQLRTTSEATLTLQSPILTCYAIVLTGLTFCFVACFKAAQLFAYIALRHFALRHSRLIRLGHSPVSKSLRTECVTLSMRPAYIKIFSFLLLNTRIFPAFSNRLISL